MSFRNNALALVALAPLAALTAPAARAQDAQAARINNSYVLSFGRFAKPSEIAYWKGRSDARAWNVGQFVNNHAAWLPSSEAGTEQEATILRAIEAAWGESTPYYGDVSRRHRANLGKTWRTHVDLVKLLTSEMDSNKALKEKVVRLSYQKVGLTPSATDIAGWVHGFGNGKSFVQMVGEHSVWKANRAGKGNIFATRPDAVMAETLRVSNASIVAMGGGNIVANGGGNIVAMGGGNIVAMGGGNIVANGGGNLAQQLQSSVGLLQNGFVLFNVGASQ